MLAISDESVEAGIGASYQLPDEGSNKGAILDLNAEMQMAFFFNDITGWYINFGQDTPEDKRIRAKIFSLFDGYAFLMINASRIRAGAGIEFSLRKSYGPAAVGASAFMDAGGFIIYRPAQIGGHIALGGAAYIEVYSFRNTIEVEAMLSAEAPRPFIITGSFMVGISVSAVFTSIDIEEEVSITWVFDSSLNHDEIDVIRPPSTDNDYRPASAVHIPTERSFPLDYAEGSQIPNPGDSAWDFNFSDEVAIPQDSFIDIEFNESVNPSEVENIGGDKFSLAEYTIQVPPEKTKSGQVDHAFKVKAVDIHYWNGNSWEPYKVYENVTPIKDRLDNIDGPELEVLKDGYWQYDNPGRFNKMRLLSQSVFSYFRRATEGNVSLDGLFKSAEFMLCEKPEKEMECYNWEEYSKGAIKGRDNNTPYFDIKSSTMEVVEESNPHGFQRGVRVSSFEPITFDFSESLAIIKLRTKTTSEGVFFRLYDRWENLIKEVYKEASELDDPVELMDPDGNIRRLRLVGAFGDLERPDNLTNDAPLRIGKRSSFHSPAVLPGSIDEVKFFERKLEPSEIQDIMNNNTTPPGAVAWWRLDGNGEEELNDHNGTVYDVLSYSDAPFNEAMEFGGFSNSYIEVDHDRQLTFENINYSITVWVKTTTIGLRVIIDKRVWGFYGYSLYTYGGHFGFQFAEGSWRNYISNAHIADGEWHFIAVVIDRTFSEGRIYIDGEFDSDFSIPLINIESESTYIFEVCKLSARDKSINEQLPSEEELNEELENMQDALQKAYQPIWRPYTKFAVTVTTENIVESNEKEPIHYTRHHHFGFKTAGPIGHFHQTDAKYDNLNDQEKDQYPLNDLRIYIDFEHSYPNANGKLTPAKPLYYKNPRLYLAFNRPYVNAMYGNWETDNGTIHNELRTKIVRPGGEEADQDPSWELADSNYDRYNYDLRPLNTILENKENCTLFGPWMSRFTLNAVFIPPELKPDKLYTAVFEAHSEGSSNEVHRYNFRTSLYKDFKDHIESIHLRDGFKAIFNLQLDPDNLDMQKVEDIFNDNIPNDDNLRSEYPHHFDRINRGIKMTSLESTETTEVNILSVNDRMIGLLVRSPEPINIPGLPKGERTQTVEVTNDEHNGATSNDYPFVYSKDLSQIFISNSAMDIPSGEIKIKLTFLQFNGKEYVAEDQATIEFDTKDYLTLS